MTPERRGPKRKLALFLGFLALATWSGQCFYGIGVATGAGVRFARLPCVCFGSQQQFQCVRKRQIPIVFFWFVSSAFMNKPFQHALHGHSWLGCVCAHVVPFSLYFSTCLLCWQTQAVQVAGHSLLGTQCDQVTSSSVT